MSENTTPTPLNHSDHSDELNSIAKSEELTTSAGQTLLSEEEQPQVHSVQAVITSSVPLTETHTEDAEVSDEEKELDSVDDELPDFSSLDKEQLVKVATDAVREKTTDEAGKILKAIRPILDHLLQDEYNVALQKFIEDGGVKDDFEFHPKDNFRELFNAASRELKQKRADEKARQDAERVDNLKRKEHIIDQIKQLTEAEETKDSLRKLKDLQTDWKTIKNVPKEHVDRLWEQYHLYIHQFYDRLTIFNELKDLDRRKNLDQKIELTKKVAELAQEPSAKRALILLKKYQEEWRNLGPVPAESNEEIWARFKHECDKIFEMIQAVQQENERIREENLSSKKALLAKALELSNFTTTRIKDWFEQTNMANQLMEDWRKIGMVPLKFRESIWNEFREARNQFFMHKNNFFKQLHAERNEHLKAKTALCEKAEQIATNPVDWNKQTEELKKLQEEWKKVGPVHDKVSDAIWKRFRAACDAFFEKKAQHYSSQVEEQKHNLETKQALIIKLEALLQREDGSDIINDLKALQDEWNNTGFVPMSEKERINKQYSELSDKVFNKFKQASKELKDLKEKSHLEALAHSPNGVQRVRREERMIIERIRGLKSDIDTWENNLGFFSKANNKGENPMVQQIQDKINVAKKHITGLEDKLKQVRSFLKQEQKA